MRKVTSLASLINSRLIGVTVVAALLASILSAMYTLVEFNFSIKPQLLKKANAIALTIHDDVDLALKAGIPLDQIGGMDSYLQDELKKYPELTFVAITTGDETVYQVGDTVPDLTQVGKEEFQNVSNQYLQAGFWQRVQTVFSELPFILNLSGNVQSNSNIFQLPLDRVAQGAVFVGLSSTYVQSQLTDIFFDIGIILIAVLLVCFEVVMVVVMFYISGPLEESERILKRQANGDFTVDERIAAQGAIGSFAEKLNQNSKELQVKYENIKNSSVTADFGDKLKAIADKFRLEQRLGMRNGEIVDARIPLFVFSFAEELQKSFMPLFVGEFYQEGSWISKEVMLGLPISVFMFVIAACTPFAAKWVDRWGQKNLFMAGLIPAIAGYIGCAMATSSMDIVIARGVTAFGYAMITISCQSYIAAVVTAENRAKGMSIFVGVLMTATMCGTALGGIIADRIGYQPVFVLSAILACFAGLLAWRMLSGQVDDARRKAAGGGSVWLLAKNIKFVAVIVCCAIPAKIILTGFLYFMVPIYLVSLDATQSEIGRVMMIYSLVIIPLSPIASSIVDKTQKVREPVVLGTLLSGAILISLYGEASLFKVLLAVTLMGVAHSILKAPLIACALEASEATPEVGRTEVLGLLRTAERVGSVIGPVLVASLIAFYSYGETMAIVGAGVFLSGLAMFFFLRMPSSPNTNQEASSS
ncbi:MFS transporter [Vibrio sp. SCSIO 43136]|uniref:MFS transporter n=1 Tax=Vibrio sp. SCSIO 43136 TaxID=2819101 RepID=UPI0020758CEA|nr:MFS transporter [Vibrio sp. SCSIO 43136]USD66336.1 MFS transporter [Vibrio sp. SCSIO 43136]